MDNKYKYIPGGFPYIENENVYEYENVFNYKAWGENTVIRVLHVPWDLDYSNVVIFDDIEARNAWTDEHTSAEYTLTTAVNIQADGSIKLPIPFDVLAKCNYIVVEYAYAPVEYEQTDRVSRMGYFIKDVMQNAPSTTQARVELDYWYTFIYDVDVTYLDLERGHAPMATTTAEKYLENPIENNTYLLTPDVNFSPDDRARLEQAAEWIANDGNNYAVFACTGNVSSAYWGTTGTRDMQVPGVAAPKFFNTRSGYDYIAIEAEQLDSFIAQCNGARPHWLQTIQGMFLVPGKLITITGSTTWAGIDGITLYYIDTSQKYYNLLKLTKENFSYDSRYTDIAKLYTYPYCHLELTDEQGNTSTVYVENTTGELGINAALNLVYPFIGMDIMPLGIGGADTVTSLYGWTGQKNFTRGGDWYSLLKHYDIPAFVVSQSQNDRARFDRYFPNAQSTTEYTNSYNSSEASITTAKTIANRNTVTGYQNALDNANASYTNSNSTYNNILFVNDTSTDYAWEMLGHAQEQQNAARALAETISATAFNAQANSTYISSVVGAAGSIQGAAANAASGNAVGTVQAAAGAFLTPIQNYAILENDQTRLTNTTTAQRAYASAMYAIVPSGSATDINYSDHVGTLNDPTGSLVGLQTATQNTYNSRFALQNKLAIEAAANTDRAVTTGGTSSLYTRGGTLADNIVYEGTIVRTQNTENANALDNYNTGHANNERTRDTAIAAIDNGNKAQGVSAPAVYGTNSGTQNAATRPLGLFVNVATQSKAAIKAAGDQFLRYGYMLDQAWQPTDWQLMKHFTYWKARDVWISGRGITIEAASEAIKAILMNGTTVWDNPDDVGRVSIYDNI